MPVSLLEDDADWVQTFRDPAIDEEPEVPVVLTSKDQLLSWGSCLAMAKLAGAKFPEVLTAQVVLESGWFAHETGHFNILGVESSSRGALLDLHYLGRDGRQGSDDPS